MPRAATPTRARRTGRRVLLLALLATAGVAALAQPPAASAAKPCWLLLINDWYDGRIDKAYAPKCYRDAIKNLPEDIAAYGDAREQIQRHLLDAIAASGGKEPKLVPPEKTKRQTGPGAPGAGDNGDAEAVPGSGGGSDDDDGGILGIFKPSNADSVPLPLLILGGLAILLLAAAGVGFASRRIQERKVRPAPSPGEPPRP